MKKTQYTLFIIFALFFSGCGYDVIFKYKRQPLVSYRLMINTSDQDQASHTLIKAFKNEGLELVSLSKYGAYENYVINHKSSRISIKLQFTPSDYKIAVISLYPARFSKHSKGRAIEQEKRKQALLSIPRILDNPNFVLTYMG